MFVNKKKLKKRRKRNETKHGRIKSNINVENRQIFMIDSWYHDTLHGRLIWIAFEV